MIGARDSPHQDTRSDWRFLYIRRLAEWFRGLICLRRYLKGQTWKNYVKSRSKSREKA
jgi:hypothetical protein